MPAIQFKQVDKADVTHQSCTIQQGTSFYFDYKSRDLNGNLLDTTGYSFDGSFKSAFDGAQSHYDGKTVFTFTVSGNSVVNDATNKRFVVLWPAALTEAVRFKNDTLEGVYDFYLTCPDGTRVRALWGDWTLTREVTA